MTTTNRKKETKETSFDIIFDELGQFGRYQLVFLPLLALSVAVGMFYISYVFSAAKLPHRCMIPECGETSKDEFFNPDWLSNAVPSGSSCERYAVALPGNGTLENCSKSLFNTSQVVKCEYYVYGKDNSVVYDFDLGCKEWLRTLAGTLNSLGTLLALPIIGYISDRYGRKIALISSMINLGLFGLIKSFSVNYPMFLVMELLQTTMGSGYASSAQVFAAELVGPNYRVLAASVLCIFAALGQMLMGLVASQVHPWRHLILALSFPAFLFISYFCIMPESIRWLLTKQKYDEAEKQLRSMAKINKKPLRDETLQALKNMAEIKIKPTGASPKSLVRSVVSSKRLLSRVCITPVWWISTTLVYYGLSINSTTLSESMYINFILTSLVEIPGFYLPVLLVNRIGRKVSLSACFLVSAVANAAFVFVPSDVLELRLAFYLLGMFGISGVFAILYVYTAELYPTEFRHSLLAFSSMVGRIGSIAAPLTPALMQYWSGAPSTLFAVMAFISAALVFTQPETLGSQLPDTIEDAEKIGRN